ncbi:MAG: DinB family protein [Planctomycetes bacterium]|nr:DinB family protein [Planctomycetota bacterium]
MSTVETFVRSYKYNRDKTLGLLDSIQKEADPQAVLGWRPGPGRAHIGWQLMHIGITEEIFASERLAPHKQGAWQELWPRFRGGSTPDDNIPTAAQIRQTLDEARQHLLTTLSDYNDSRLAEVPEALKARNLTVLDVLHIIGWHEAHHQGQSHITFNLYKASRAK